MIGKLFNDKEKRNKISNDPEDVGYWSKKKEINSGLKKLMAKWWKN